MDNLKNLILKFLNGIIESILKIEECKINIVNFEGLNSANFWESIFENEKLTKSGLKFENLRNPKWNYWEVTSANLFNETNNIFISNKNNCKHIIFYL